MAQPPMSVTQEQFLQVIQSTGQVPALVEDLAKEGWTNDKEGLRAVRSKLMPDGVDAWVFENGFCMVRPELFDLMKRAMQQCQETDSKSS